ncbi:hypothetical protein IL306_011068, partial [Fusarium sp. DS 682]
MQPTTLKKVKPKTPTLEEHLKSVYGSQYAREHVGPDAVNFSDFGVALPVTVQERVISLPQNDNVPEDVDLLSSSFVAMYYISVTSGDNEDIITGFTKSLQNFAASQIRYLIANTPAQLEVDADAYFGSNPNRPKFNLIFSIHLHGKEGVAGIRKAQKIFQGEFASKINLGNTWIAFGQRGLVFDQENKIQ